MEKADTMPVCARVMAPLRDVLCPGVVVEPVEDQTLGMIRIQFTPPITIEPAGSIDYITCPASDVTVGWV
jgi:hypothetical protein